MSEQGNSAHIYRLDDGKFRLTFISSSPSGGQFLSEIGDFTRGELELWLKDGHLYPSTDFDALRLSRHIQTRIKGMRDSYYRIDLRGVPEQYRRESLLKVLPRSPLRLRREVEKLAYYFRREFHYDFVQFGASDNEPYTAYLFSRDSVWLGACCFRTPYYADLDSKIETLAWIWARPT